MQSYLTLEDAQAHCLAESPGIYIFEDFAQHIEVDDLLEAALPRLNPALVSGNSSGVVSQGRSGRNCWIPHDQTPAIQSLALRISKLVGLPLSHAESFQVIHYDEHQEYQAHFDAWDPETERGQRCMAKGGQRLITCLLYLNHVESGGGTGFPKLELEVEAQPMRLLVFYNCYPNSDVCHPLSLHAGLPVQKGEKWACNLWFRARPYRL